jgi:hypothetical protein
MKRGSMATNTYSTCLINRQPQYTAEVSLFLGLDALASQDVQQAVRSRC